MGTSVRRTRLKCPFTNSGAALTHVSASANAFSCSPIFRKHALRFASATWCAGFNSSALV
jgi:hypothetical protein|eukprot:26474-Pelagococcus_subviridis.AAC.1